MNRYFIIFILILSAAVSGIILSLPGFDTRALLAGNALMTLLTAGAWLMVRRQIAARPQAFARSVYAANLMKLLVCLAAFLAYAIINRHSVHKPSLFALFGIYLIFTIPETAALSRLARTVKQTP